VARGLLVNPGGVVQVGSPPPGPCTALFLFCVVLGAITVGVGCNRTPSEPIGPIPQVQATTQAADARCIRPLAVDPPPTPTVAKNCPADPGPQPMLGHTTIGFENGVEVKVEIARTEEETSRGLMYRTVMPENEGMIFAMDRREHTFWMRNTCLPLDMLFIDRDGTIVGIEENVPTLNDASRSCGCESTHVLEVNAGWSRRHGVKAGQKVKLPLP
jgi:hypothetical protein